MPNTEHKPTERVLNILELLSEEPAGLSLSDIAKGIGSPKTTIVPVLHTMANRKFIVFHPDTNLYSIGIASYLAGNSFYSEKSIMQFIRNEMQHVVEEVNEICQFGIRSKDCVLYVAKVDCKEPIRLVSSVGKRLPLYCTALGKALLYQIPFDEIRRVYPNGLKKLTEHTIDDFGHLEKELEEVNRNKFAYERMEVMPEVCCYAVPVCNDGKTLASLSVSVPVFRDTPEKAGLIKKVLILAGKTIEQFLSNQDCDKTIFQMDG